MATYDSAPIGAQGFPATLRIIIDTSLASFVCVVVILVWLVGLLLSA